MNCITNNLAGKLAVFFALVMTLGVVIPCLANGDEETPAEVMGRVSGVALNPDGIPLTTGTLTVFGEAENFGLRLAGQQSAKIDAKTGRFEFARLRPGAYRIQLYSPGYALQPSTMLIVPRTTLHLVLRTHKCAAIRIRVLKDGQPVAGARILLYKNSGAGSDLFTYREGVGMTSKAALTSEDGSVVFNSIPIFKEQIEQGKGWKLEVRCDAPGFRTVFEKFRVKTYDHRLTIRLKSKKNTELEFASKWSGWVGVHNLPWAALVNPTLGPLMTRNKTHSARWFSVKDGKASIVLPKSRRFHFVFFDTDQGLAYQTLERRQVKGRVIKLDLDWRPLVVASFDAGLRSAERWIVNIVPRRSVKREGPPPASMASVIGKSGEFIMPSTGGPFSVFFLGEKIGDSFLLRPTAPAQFELGEQPKHELINYSFIGDFPSRALNRHLPPKEKGSVHLQIRSQIVKVYKGQTHANLKRCWFFLEQAYHGDVRGSKVEKLFRLATEMSSLRAELYCNKEGVVTRKFVNSYFQRPDSFFIFNNQSIAICKDGKFTQEGSKLTLRFFDPRSQKKQDADKK